MSGYTTKHRKNRRNKLTKTLYPLFKYTVYFLLAMNVYWFFAEERLAAKLLYPDGVGLFDLFGAYPGAIDTAAWVLLLLMFELETYVLEDHHFTNPVNWLLRTLRVLSYVIIFSAFVGYIETLFSVHDTVPAAGVTDLCSLVGGNWSYSYTLEEYELLTAANCASFSGATSFIEFNDARAVVDADGLVAIRGLAWIDVINAGVWLLVVLLLEIDVWLQEQQRFEGLVLRVSTVGKFGLYTTLLFAAIYWGVKGDFIDFWDAFLWLVAFVFIELNVFEWRKEELAEASG